MLKRNRVHKQYSARLPRWLDRLSHFDVNVQNTAGKNIPLTDYLSRHPIVSTVENETESSVSGLFETEAEEEFVINQIHGLFDIIQMNGRIMRLKEPTKSRQKNDQSPHGTRKREQNEKVYSREASTSSNGVYSISPNKPPKSNCLPSKAKMDKVNDIDIYFIYKMRGHSPETHRLWTERKRILKPEKTKIVGKGSYNERLQEYRLSQRGRKQFRERNIRIYN